MYRHVDLLQEPPACLSSRLSWFQVAETEAELVQRLVARKTEPLVRLAIVSTYICWHRSNALVRRQRKRVGTCKCRTRCLPEFRQQGVSASTFKNLTTVSTLTSHGLRVADARLGSFQRHVPNCCPKTVGYAVVVNREGRLAATVDSISAVIEAEKCRVQRRGHNV